METFHRPFLPKTVEVFGAKVNPEVLSDTSEGLLSDWLQSKLITKSTIVNNSDCNGVLKNLKPSMPSYYKHFLGSLIFSFMMLVDMNAMLFYILCPENNVALAVPDEVRGRYSGGTILRVAKYQQICNVTTENQGRELSDERLGLVKFLIKSSL